MGPCLSNSNGGDLDTSETDIENLQSGQVALLKGERWQGNEGARLGLVHRSPDLDKGEPRFLLSLDFC